MSGMWVALKRVMPYVLFGLLPLLTLVLFAVDLRTNFGTDFRHELYPEAKLILEGKDPFPGIHADLSRGTNRIFPIPGALLVAPLTALGVGPASFVFGGILLLALASTVWIVGVTDWRVYGLVALWPASHAAIQTGNLTIILGLLVAVAWRCRNRRYSPGLAIGVAIALKLFLWPLLVWLVAVRAYRSAALGVILGITGGFLAVLPFASLTHFVQLENRLGHVFGPMSYNLVGLLVKSGAASYTPATAIADAVGLIVLVIAYRRRSLPLAVSASLILSPIVWLHYFVLLLVPIAIRRPALAGAWFIPLLLWPCSGTANEIREWQIVLAVSVLALVSVINERDPVPIARYFRRDPLPAEAG
jgi:alpha-1,2-mannosyltransferase